MKITPATLMTSDTHWCYQVIYRERTLYVYYVPYFMGFSGHGMLKHLESRILIHLYTSGNTKSGQREYDFVIYS